MRLRAIGFISLIILSIPLTIRAAEAGGHDAAAFSLSLFFVGLLILLAKIGALVERLGQPAVLGELIVGIILGNLSLIGIGWFDSVKNDTVLLFLAEMGVVLLLFQVGLESNIQKMKAVGMSAFIVATIGVVAPFALGALFIGPFFFPQLGFIAHLFIGAALTATSVGITARVFQDMNISKSREAQIVINAAVIDDVMGLIILAVVSAVAITGTIDIFGVSLIMGKAILFLLGAIVIGSRIAGPMGNFFSNIHSGPGMKMAVALFICFSFAYFASLVGLAGIVGAYAAGLILDPVHFKNFRRSKTSETLQEFTTDIRDVESREKFHELGDLLNERHVEDLARHLSYLVTPLFFIFTGMQVNLQTFTDPSLWGVAGAIILVAVVSKLIAGVGGAKGTDRTLIGIGMIPRGEVGLIFATMGLSLGVFTEQLYAVMVIMVIVTTFITPPLLTVVIRRMASVQ